MPEFTVVVPVRTFQTFVVEAESAMGAKRMVGRWIRGRREEDDKLSVLDDIGQEVTYAGVQTWEVEG